MSDDEFLKLNRELARETHRSHIESQNSFMRATVDFALEAIRTATIINGGAVIACLTFLGALYGADNGVDKALSVPVSKAALSFVTGAVFSGVASGFAYFAQYCYNRAAEEARMTWDHPYIEYGDQSKRYNRTGAVWHYASCAAVIASYLATITGLAIAGPAFFL
ncbi:hypothetical protein O9X94_23415 [Agrobacterium leguminum]|uniref:Uncharacterized protein n=1 Tax=Agrobacterium leguminum TaxID=2792015 RepID=A0A9X3KIF4_9HYPH|nr:hypothetical protein [Agrobacterium leguminum]MCZ7912286.1 hypothetical protein [Agrobacterium leguminum]